MLLKGKRMEAILLLMFLSNAFIGTSYLVDGSGINGAASCYLGALQTIINYFFDRKGKPLPGWLVAVYAAAFVALNFVTGGFTWLSVLAIAACLTFVFQIGAGSGNKYRIWSLVNMLLWALYDVLSGSYGALLTHLPLAAIAIAGMFLHDRKKAAE